MPHVQVTVITNDRPGSLARLFKSMKQALYFGDTLDLRINLEQDADPRTHKLVEMFRWEHGATFVSHRVVHGGLLPAVVESWYPHSNNSYGLLLEDDVELSPLFYAWVKMTLLRYRYALPSRHALLFRLVETLADTEKGRISHLNSLGLAFINKRISRPGLKADSPSTLEQSSQLRTWQLTTHRTFPRYPAAGERSTSPNTGASSIPTLTFASPRPFLISTRWWFRTRGRIVGRNRGRNTSSNWLICADTSWCTPTTTISCPSLQITSRSGHM